MKRRDSWSVWIVVGAGTVAAFFLLLTLVFSVQASAATRHHRNTHRVRRVWVAFPASHESLLAQNVEIDKLGLPRIKNDRELRELVKDGELVPILPTVTLRIAGNLPKNRRYCRPWVLAFLDDTSAAYYTEFGKPLQVNSVVRTVQVQRSLTHWNHNAAPAHGQTASSHLAGLTVDIARRGMTKEQIAWMENYLLSLGDQVIVEEEIAQPCFHVCVRGNYKGANHETDSISRIDSDVGARAVGQGTQP